MKGNFFFFLAALGFRCCLWAFSSCSEQGLLCRSVWASRCRGFLCCGARTRGVWAQ